MPSFPAVSVAVKGALLLLVSLTAQQFSAEMTRQTESTARPPVTRYHSDRTAQKEAVSSSLAPPLACHIASGTNPPSIMSTRKNSAFRGVFRSRESLSGEGSDDTPWDIEARRLHNPKLRMSSAVKVMMKFIERMPVCDWEKLMEFVGSQRYRAVVMPQAVLKAWIASKSKQHAGASMKYVDDDVRFLSREALCFTDRDPAFILTDGGKVTLSGLFPTSKKEYYPIACGLIRQLRSLELHGEGSVAALKPENIVCWKQDVCDWKFCFRPDSIRTNEGHKDETSHIALQRDRIKSLGNVVTHLRRKLLGLRRLYNDNVADDCRNRCRDTESFQWASDKLKERNNLLRSTGEIKLPSKADPWLNALPLSQQQILYNYMRKLNQALNETRQSEKEALRQLVGTGPGGGVTGATTLRHDVDRLDRIARILATGTPDALENAYQVALAGLCPRGGLEGLWCFSPRGAVLRKHRRLEKLLRTGPPVRRTQHVA